MLPAVPYPSCLHTTIASSVDQYSAQIVPHTLFRQISTLPSNWLTSPSTSLISPSTQLVLLADVLQSVGNYHIIIIMCANLCEIDHLDIWPQHLHCVYSCSGWGVCSPEEITRSRYSESYPLELDHILDQSMHQTMPLLLKKINYYEYVADWYVQHTHNNLPSGWPYKWLASFKTGQPDLNCYHQPGLL